MLLMENTKKINENLQLTYTEHATLPFYSQNEESCYVDKNMSSCEKSNILDINPDPDEMIKKTQNNMNL